MPVRNGDMPEPLGGQTTQCAPPTRDDEDTPREVAPRRPPVVPPAPEVDGPPLAAALNPLPPPPLPTPVPVVVAAAALLVPVVEVVALVALVAGVVPAEKLGNDTAPAPEG